MTLLPQCSDLAQRGYTPEAINVIQANGKCGDENGIPLRTSSTQNTPPGRKSPLGSLSDFGIYPGSHSSVWFNRLGAIGRVELARAAGQVLKLSSWA